MEGIDPYIETIGACHLTYRSVPWASGRWRASTPTLKPLVRPIQRTGGISWGFSNGGDMRICRFFLFHLTNRCDFFGGLVDVGIDPYIETIGACHSTYWSVALGCGRLVAAPTSLL